MDNHFDSKGGEQNIAQGDHAIGKQMNNFFYRLLGRIFTTGNQSPAIAAGRDVTVTYNNSYYGYSVSIELFTKYVKELAVTDLALVSFFKILNEQQVPRSDLDSKLREVAGHYKELLLRLETVQSEDPQVVRMKGEARQAIELGDYAKAEELLNQAEALDLKAIEQIEKTAKQRASPLRRQMPTKPSCKKCSCATPRLPSAGRKPPPCCRKMRIMTRHTISMRQDVT